MDPANLFDSHEYESGIADILIAKKNVANIYNYDDRLLQKYFIEKSIESKEILVFGSSRVMQIDKSFFLNKSFFNHGVSGASLEDYIAIFTMYKERNWIPQKIIIGLDAWILNKNSEQNRWQSLYEEYNKANFYLELDNIEKLTYLNKNLFRKYIQLISMPYFKTAYVNWKNTNNQGKYYPTIESKLDVLVKCADGSISYPLEVRNISTESARKKALDYANEFPVYSLGKFEELDEKNKKIFECFIKYLQKCNIEVVFILSPYHPLVYNTLINDSKYSMVLESEKYFKYFAQIQNIKVIGSYDPSKCKLSEKDFLDGMHLKSEGIAKILKMNL
jgi:lysophospholipase L1-like esterase